MELANPFIKRDFQKRPRLFIILPKSRSLSASLNCLSSIFGSSAQLDPSRTQITQPSWHKPVLCPRADHSLLRAAVCFSGPKDADWSYLTVTALGHEQKLTPFEAPTSSALEVSRPLVPVIIFKKFNMS